MGSPQNHNQIIARACECDQGHKNDGLARALARWPFRARRVNARQPMSGTQRLLWCHCWVAWSCRRTGVGCRYLSRLVPGNQCDDSNDHQIQYAGNHAIADARVFPGLVRLHSVKRICHLINSVRPCCHLQGGLISQLSLPGVCSSVQKESQRRFSSAEALRR
jgi:hypothetical protein